MVLTLDGRNYGQAAIGLLTYGSPLPGLPRTGRTLMETTITCEFKSRSNAGALDRDKQLDVVRRLTDLVSSAVGDPYLAQRTWVILAAAAPGGWGLWGHAHANQELMDAAGAEIPRLRG